LGKFVFFDKWKPLENKVDNKETREERSEMNRQEDLPPQKIKEIQTRYWAKLILQISESKIMIQTGQIIPKGKLSKFQLKSTYWFSSEFFKGWQNPKQKVKGHWSWSRVQNIRRNLLPLIDMSVLLGTMQVVNNLIMSCQREICVSILEMEYESVPPVHDLKSYLFWGILILTTIVIIGSFYDQIVYQFTLQEWRLAQEAAMITDPIIRYQMGILGPLSERDLEQLQLYLANQAVIDNLATSPISYRWMEMWLF
jgi:hypothetical protein